jgi:hypothetical protein
MTVRRDITVTSRSVQAGLNYVVPALGVTICTRKQGLLGIHSYLSFMWPLRNLTFDINSCAMEESTCQNHTVATSFRFSTFGDTQTKTMSTSSKTSLTLQSSYSINSAYSLAHGVILDLSLRSTSSSITAVDNVSLNSSCTCVESDGAPPSVNHTTTTAHSTNLSEAALTAHMLNFDPNAEAREAHERLNALQAAAGELEINLPNSCFEKERWQLPDWAEGTWAML